MSLFFCALLAISGFGAQGADFSARVNGDGVNLRADSTVSSSVICELRQGETLKVSGARYEWYRVRLPRRVSLFVSDELLVPLEPALPAPASNIIPDAPPKRNARALKDRINLRLAPDQNAPVLGMLEAGQVVELSGREAGWWKILPPENAFGWVHQKFLEKIPEPPLPPTPAPAAEIKPPPKQPEDRDPGSVIVDGEVRPYGMVFGRKATHKLLTAQKGIFLLKGSKRTLDGLNYRKVKVKGKVISDKKAKTPILQVEKISLIAD